MFTAYDKHEELAAAFTEPKVHTAVVKIFQDLKSLAVFNLAVDGLTVEERRAAALLFGRLTLETATDDTDLTISDVEAGCKAAMSGLEQALINMETTNG